jgi:hypothetical protein
MFPAPRIRNSEMATFRSTAMTGVVHGPNGDYVRTYADGQWNDNLLALMERVY